MLPESIRSLIVDEQRRQQDRFVENVALEEYLTKLGEKAEIVMDWAAGRCRGFVAFYCNDESTRQAFITLVLVDPRDRGLGIGRVLMTSVLALAGRRGFTSCRLEVAAGNETAQAWYQSLGFRVVETKTRTHLLEIGL